MDTDNGTHGSTHGSTVDGASHGTLSSGVAGAVHGSAAGGVDTTVLVLGQVAALEQLVSRLIACGVLADADPVLPDAADPVRGSCLLRMTDQGGGRRQRHGSDHRTTPERLLAALAAWLRRSGPDSARRHSGGRRVGCRTGAVG